MVELVSLPVNLRSSLGKKATRAERRDNRVPAVIYGNNEQNIPISIEGKQLDKLLQSSQFFTQIFELDVEGKKHQVLARDLQLHPVNDRPLHVDFMRFNENTRIVLLIPAIFINEEDSPGLKRGGVLNIVRREVELLCSPLKIPKELVFDLADLEIGATIHIGDIELPEGVSTVTDRDFTVATIAAPTVMPADDEPDEEGEETEDGEESQEAATDTGDSSEASEDAGEKED